jgi:hypothetical protein
MTARVEATMTVLADDLIERLASSLCGVLAQVRDTKGLKGGITLTLTVERIDDTETVEVSYKLKQTVGDVAASAGGSTVNGQFRVPEAQLSLKVLNSMETDK